MGRSELVHQLSSARNSFAGIGTRAAKLKLNRLGNSSSVARAYRLALEIEDRSIQGKKYRRSEWSDRAYFEKSRLIEELAQLCEKEGWTYGQHKTGGWPQHVVYFDLPGCEQISFHTTLKNPEAVPHYPKEWDGKRSSTLGKLEAAFMAFRHNDDQLVMQLF